VQIRTHEMHAHAELGVAAHWRYKEGGGGDAEFERKIAWMRQLLEGAPRATTTPRCWPAVDRADRGPRLRADAAGEVVDLPRGATVLDFAYHVHTEVGHRCRGAKVNGRIVPLTHAPRSGDRVEILTARPPSRAATGCCRPTAILPARARATRCAPGSTSSTRRATCRR
jgi:GTP pyrophosphokinase